MPGTPGKPPGTPGKAPAAPGGRSQQAGGGLKPGSLASSCKMNSGNLNMTVAPGVKSSSTVYRKFVFHIGQFCKDKNVDQSASCWPFLAEVARCNSNHFKSGASAGTIMETVALGRCPNAHDMAHCRTKHNLLSNTLMLELGAAPYFRPA